MKNHWHRSWVTALFCTINLQKQTFVWRTKFLCKVTMNSNLGQRRQLCEKNLRKCQLSQRRFTCTSIETWSPRLTNWLSTSSAWPNLSSISLREPGKNTREISEQLKSAKMRHFYQSLKILNVQLECIILHSLTYRIWTLTISIEFLAESSNPSIQKMATSFWLKQIKTLKRSVLRDPSPANLMPPLNWKFLCQKLPWTKTLGKESRKIRTRNK